MSDEDALLAAIQAHPDEDTPRLVYADWLDENRQHIRAEFIRVQIEAARVGTLPRAIVNRHVEVFRRQQELLDLHRGELLGPLAALRGNARCEFERGFVSEVVLSVRQFHEHRNLLAGVRPLPRIVVSSGVMSVCRFLGFDLGASDREPRADLVSAIRTEADGEISWMADRVELEVRRWPRLDDLDLSGCRLGDVNLFSLLHDESFPVLSRLDISANELTNGAVNVLLHSGIAPRLRHLILGGNPISDAGALELASVWPGGDQDRLEHLNLRFTNIGTRGQQALLSRFGGRIDLF